MFNNLKLINKAFDYIINEEKKLNYEYEPHFEEHDENWKRHLFFFELKKDFIKDVTEFGFCPYIQKPCEEQRRDKNIMRFQKIDNFVRTDYIKNIYKKITANTNRKIKREKSLSPKRAKFTLILKKNNSMKDIGHIAHINKLNNDNNTFLSKIYNKIKIRKREINNLKLGKNILNVNKNIKQNNDNIENLLGKKSNKNEDGQMEDESFIYEPDKSNMKYNNFYALNREKSKDTNNKDDSLSNSSNNNKNEDNNKDYNSYEMVNGEIKKKGWKMTTSLEGDKLFRNLKGSFTFHKNIDNHKNYIPASMARTNKIIINNNKIGKSILKSNSTKLKLNKNNSGKNGKMNIFCKKIENNSKKKDKKYKLFFHVRKYKKDFLQNDF